MVDAEKESAKANCASLFADEGAIGAWEASLMPPGQPISRLTGPASGGLPFCNIKRPPKPIATRVTF